MINREFKLNDGTKIKRISKTTAIKLFNQGVAIHFYPVNANPLNGFNSPYVVRDNADGYTFNAYNDAFTTYLTTWCSSKMGKYPAYYIEIA